MRHRINVTDSRNNSETRKRLSVAAPPGM